MPSAGCKNKNGSETRARSARQLSGIAYASKPSAAARDESRGAVVAIAHAYVLGPLGNIAVLRAPSVRASREARSARRANGGGNAVAAALVRRSLLPRISERRFLPCIPSECARLVMSVAHCREVSVSAAEGGNDAKSANCAALLHLNRFVAG